MIVFDFYFVYVCYQYIYFYFLFILAYNTYLRQTFFLIHSKGIHSLSVLAVYNSSVHHKLYNTLAVYYIFCHKFIIKDTFLSCFLDFLCHFCFYFLLHYDLTMHRNFKLISLVHLCDSCGHTQKLRFPQYTVNLSPILS